MSPLLAQLRERQTALVRRLPRWWNRGLAVALIVFGIVVPFLFPADSGFMNGTIIAVAYAVMSLGLNIVVGFAGLLDLGYVAFYALGAYSLGWFGSGFFFKLHIHVLVSPVESTLQGIHLNFIFDPDRRRADLRGGGDGDRPADAAPARRLHRDRHARVR